MLLQEQKNENSSVCYYDSSNVLASKYRYDTSQLAVIFKDGSQYVYDKVSNYTFQRFKIADSQGSAIIKHIKGKFDFTKVDGKIDTTEIIECIKILKEQKQSKE